MRCSLRLPTDRVDLGAEFVSAAGVAEVARAAEVAGFDGVHVTDHPFPEDEWMRTGGHHALDPFVALAWSGAATTRLRLMTHIYVLPYRNPFLSAKAAASLDVLSGGRFIFGLAAGYLEPEFRALGVALGERNELTDEAIRAMKAAWAGSGVRFQGKHFTANGHTMLPRPAQQPHPPIWVGGNAKQAIRRAVELGDGWMPFPNPRQHMARRHTAALETVEDLRQRVAYMREHARAVGRTAPLDVSMAPLVGGFGTPRWSAQAFAEHVAQLKAAGVTHLTLGLPGETRKDLLKNIGRFAKEALARLP